LRRSSSNGPEPEDFLVVVFQRSAPAGDLRLCIHGDGILNEFKCGRYFH